MESSSHARAAAGLLVVLLVALARSAPAQDAHYWTNQYGTDGALLSGLIVGSFNDLSTTYYNPAGVALTADPRLILSTDALQVTSINIDNGAGRDADLSSVRFRPTPSMFAYRLPEEWAGKHDFAVSLFTRQDWDFEASARDIDEFMPDLPPAEQAFRVGEAALSSRLNEGWAGITWALRTSETVSVGATGYVAVRGRNDRRQALTEAADGAGNGAATILLDDVKYWNVRALLKGGVAINLDPLSLGLTITTPSLNLFGDGNILVNVGRINVPDSTGNGATELAANYQEGLSSTFKSPFSAALGARYRFGKSAIYFSSEWFSSIDAYEVLSPESWVAQTTGDTIRVPVVQAARSLLNWGLGGEHRFTEAFKLFGAFTTDKSASDKDPRLLSIATWNILHATVGSKFAVGTAALTLGLGFSFGNDSVEEPLDIVGQPIDASANYLRFKLLFGLSFKV